MNSSTRYLAGTALVGVGGVLASAAVRPAERPAVWLAVALAVMVQGPLGWWVLRSLGRPELLRAWGAGLLARFALLALAAWVVAPLTGVATGALLIALAGLLLALLLVEAFALR